MVDLARKNLFHDKLRFVITVSGVAFAVSLVLLQVGLFVGLLDNATVIVDHIDADLWVTSHNTANVDFSHSFPETYVQRVRSVAGVERADNLIVAYMDIALPDGAQEGTLVYALENFRLWGVPWNVESGNPDDLRRGRFVMLDASAEQRMGPFEVGDYREYLGHRLRVVGKVHDALSFTTSPVSFMDYHLAQEINPERYEGQTAYILAKLSPGADLEAARAEIRARLPYHDVYTKAEWSAASRTYWVKNTGIGFSMYLTVFLGCLVGLVIVAQTLYTSTMEHIREFGTLKAIGGTNATIYGIIGRQAAISGVVGFALGLIPAIAMKPVILSAGLKLIIPPSFFAVVFVGTLLMCLAAGLISFRKVASIDPALVFRT